VSALNNIFNNLPTISLGHIFCSDNPGYAACDSTIAEKKGWLVNIRN